MAIIKKTEREKQADKLLKLMELKITNPDDRKAALTLAGEMYEELDKPRRKKGVSPDVELTEENSYKPPKYRIKSIQNAVEKKFPSYFETPKKQKEEREIYNPFTKALNK